MAIVWGSAVAVRSWRNYTGGEKKCGGCSGELLWLVAVMVDGCSDIEELVVAHGGAVWVNRVAVEKKEKKWWKCRKEWGLLAGLKKG